MNYAHDSTTVLNMISNARIERAMARLRGDGTQLCNFCPNPASQARLASGHDSPKVWDAGSDGSTRK